MRGGGGGALTPWYVTWGDLYILIKSIRVAGLVQSLNIATSLVDRVLGN